MLHLSAKHKPTAAEALVYSSQCLPANEFWLMEGTVTVIWGGGGRGVLGGEGGGGKF